MPSENGLADSYAHGPAWVIVLHGEIDLEILPPIQDEVARVLRETSGPLLFDVRAVGFCDSSTLNLLLNTRRQAVVAVVAPSPHVTRLLEVTGVTAVLPVFDSADAAVEGLTAAGQDT